MEVRDFKWVKGKNDYEYIQLLEAECKRKDAIISRAINKLKADRKTEPSGYNLSPVAKDINVRSKSQIDEFFREPTAEERKAVAEYIESISIPTGVNIFDLMDEPQTDCDRKCVQTEVGCEQTDCAWR